MIGSARLVNKKLEKQLHICTKTFERCLLNFEEYVYVYQKYFSNIKIATSYFATIFRFIEQTSLSHRAYLHFSFV